MGGLTTISLGALIVFHLAFGLGNLLKVLRASTVFQQILVELDLPQIPPYDPSANLVGEGTPGKGDTPIEKLLEGVFACW